MISNARPTPPLPPEQDAEIGLFKETLAALESGAIDSDDFRRFRLENGVYGIRNAADEHMIRIKLKWGHLTAAQLRALADIAEEFAPLKVAHVTTRQAIQMHRIKRRDVPAFLTRVAACGLTTREACGNTVRNVTACHFAGTSPDEVFDVRPYAQAVADYFLRNPVCQNLPRKFKIAFEGCPTDHIRAPIHDVGAVAKVRQENGKTVRGFRLFVAGGLGATPHAAQLLEDFTPEDWLIPSIEACIRIHDRYGNRKDKAKARLKFVMKEWGLERFREAVFEERKIALLTRSGRHPDFKVNPDAFKEEPPVVSLPASIAEPNDAAYTLWRLTNVKRQKQAGHVTVLVRCLLGDITVSQMRALAEVADKFCGGRLRSAITQNLVLQWVPEKALPLVYTELQKAGLAEANAERVADITRCPGADTCQIAITHSRGLASSLTPIFSNGLSTAEELQDIKIKISGCFNSCGQHHIADIGFYGSTKVIDGHEIPHYVMLLGGYTEEGVAKFGKPILQIPARRVPEAVRTLLEFFRKERLGQETFRPFVDRVGTARIKELLAPFSTVDPADPKKYEDLGAEGSAFKMEMGKGECAA